MNVPTSPAATLSLALLDNGIDFISTALDYLAGAPDSRDLKYAVLHLASGIELILKERLRRQDWTLVVNKPEAADLTRYEAGEFNSVSFKDCFSRLAKHCGISIDERDKQRLLAFRQKRHRREHFGIVDSRDAVVAAAVHAITFLLDFVERELQPPRWYPGWRPGDPKRLLGDIRQQLVEASVFVDARRTEIAPALRRYSVVLECPACTETALTIADGPHCLFCEARGDADRVAEAYLSDVVGLDYRMTIEDGDTWPRHTCPNCDENALVDLGASGDMEPAVQYRCFSCEAAFHEGELVDCPNCGELMSRADELAACNQCFAWSVARGD